MATDQIDDEVDSGTFDAVLDHEMIKPARRAMRQLGTRIDVLGRNRSPFLQARSFTEGEIIGHVQAPFRQSHQARPSRAISQTQKPAGATRLVTSGQVSGTPLPPTTDNR